VPDCFRLDRCRLTASVGLEASLGPPCVSCLLLRASLATVHTPNQFAWMRAVHRCLMLRRPHSSLPLTRPLSSVLSHSLPRRRWRRCTICCSTCATVRPCVDCCFVGQAWCPRLDVLALLPRAALTVCMVLSVFNPGAVVPMTPAVLIYPVCLSSHCAAEQSVSSRLSDGFYNKVDNFLAMLLFRDPDGSGCE
jgi:hypothetical protein